MAEDKSKLNFATEWSANAKLDFVVGDGTTPPVLIDIQAVNYLIPPLSLGSLSPIIEIVGSTVTDAPVSDGDLAHIIEVVADTVSNKPTSNATFDFDINVFDGFRNELSTTAYDSKKLDELKTSLFADSPKLYEINVVTLFDGDNLARSNVSPQRELEKEQSNKIVPLYDGDRLDNVVIHSLIGVVDADATKTALHDDGVALSQGVNSFYKHPPRSDCAKSAYWLDAERMRHDVATDFDQGLPITKEWYSYHEDAINPIGYRPIIIDPPIEPPVVHNGELNFKKLWDSLGELDFLYIELEALILMNEVRMWHVAPDGTLTELNPVGLSLSSDRDSFAWSVRVDLYEENAPALLGGAGKFRISINDIIWEVISFKYQRNADKGFTATMVSETQKLGSPSCELIDVVVDNPISAKAMITNLCQASGLSVIDNGFVDWIIHDDTAQWINAEPKSIIADVVKSVGASMTATLDGTSLIIQPRYKTSFDKLDQLLDEECDVLINPDYMVEMSGENNQSIVLDNVLVQGQQLASNGIDGGVVTRCIKDGTSGLNEAQSVTSPLQQDHNQNAELARNIFSESGSKNISAITVGIDGNLAKGGDIVRILSTPPRTGISLGTTITVGDDQIPLQQMSIEFPLEAY